MTEWQAGKRVEIDIGCAWKKESMAKNEMRELTKTHASTTYSLQKQK